MKKLTTSELRKAYLDFFVERGHRLIKSDSLVPANDPSVLFTSAGMNQFKECFLGKIKDFRRATSSQKCLRTGDLDEVGRTPYHHTFFEMLGNFSFGDYFKKEAIQWAWEFVTEELGIDKNHLWVSVYQDDEEAFNIWKKDIGVPVQMIKKFGQKENFWPSSAISDGPNGPCGPCSEIYYQKKNGESVEVWNLVFTQSNRRDGGVLELLPSKNIDTGMGLERMASVLQGVDSNFKIDIFIPIVEAVRKSTGLRDEKIVHMIADHGRAVAFCICDGVLPSNDGRGYVVRKLIRRCLYLAQAKDPKPFLYKIVSSVAAAMADQYPELSERRDNIAQIIKAEEEKYIKNILETGSEKIQEVASQCKESGQTEVPPQIVADMYMTHGIPIESAAEVFKKMGLASDVNLAFEIVKLDQDKARASSKMAGMIFSKGSVSLKNSEFIGYDSDSCEAKIIQIIKDGQEVNEVQSAEDIGVVLSKTPFYAESGGQIGDTGVIVQKNSDLKIIVKDTKKQDGSIIHLGEVSGQGQRIKVGDVVMASVDAGRREAIKRAHTATHVLQAVLRKVLGPHVQQAGSLVEPDRFRFDFTHFQDITNEEMDDIQKLLNEYVIKNDKLQAQEMKKAEAQKTGAIALFGEKYEDEVRVVSIGDYSKEFCGGTHLDFTGSIGFILITSESSVGSGLRRMEALTGKLAYKETMDISLAAATAASSVNIKPAELPQAVRQLKMDLASSQKEILKYKEQNLNSDVEAILKKPAKIGDISFFSHKFKNFDVNLLRKTVDLLKAKVPSQGVFLFSSVLGENVYFVCGLTQDLVKRGFSADELIKNSLSCATGSGGGRKDFAQGGTKEMDKVDLVFKEVERLVKEKL